MLGYSMKQIRRHLQSSLSGISSVQGRVLSGEAEPGIGLPSIVYSIATERLDDDSAYMKTGDDPHERKMQLTIEGRALLRSGSEVPIDDLCWDIENAVRGNPVLNSWSQELRLNSTSYQMEEAESPIGLATLIYEGYYHEVDLNEVEELRYDPTRFSIYASFITSAPGQAKVIAIGPDNSIHESEVEQESSIFHEVTVSGLAPNTAYEMYYMFGPNQMHDLTDGYEPSIAQTLP